MKKILGLIFFILSIQLQAQTGFWEQHQFNYSSINPAYIGERGSFAVNGILGNQFNGTIRPNQVSQIVTIDGQLYGNKSNLGFNGYRGLASNGIFSNSINLSYSYLIEVNDLKLKIGVNTGILVVPIATINATGNSVKPFIGYGFAGFYKGLNFGISNPIAFSQNTNFTTKPYFLNLGYLYKPASNLSFSIMGIYELNLNNNEGNAIILNPKAILNNKFSFGLSIRNRVYENKTLNSTKFIPIVEYRATSSIMMGLSLDTKPSNNFTNNINASNRGVAQLMIRIQTDNENKGLLEGF
jgi:hypothetical protein